MTVANPLYSFRVIWSPEDDAYVATRLSSRACRGSAGPRSLHSRLVQRAADEGVSLNSYATSLLAEGVGAAD